MADKCKSDCFNVNMDVDEENSNVRIQHEEGDEDLEETVVDVLGHMNSHSSTSMERLENFSMEGTKKCQDNNETLLSEEGNSESENLTNDKNENGNLKTIKFHKLKSKVKKRNYRNKMNSMHEDGNNSNDMDCYESQDEEQDNTQNENNQDIVPIVDPDLNNSISIHDMESLEEDWEINTNEAVDEEEKRDVYSDECSTASDNEPEKEVFAAFLKNEKPKPKWFIVPDIICREMGVNQFINRRFYSSLHVVERLELMYRMSEHNGSVNTLNFNQKGNLLASGSDDLAVIIWDWATGKKHLSFQSGHRSNIFHVKWLPSDAEHLLATCASDGQVRLLDIRHGSSYKLTTHDKPAHKITVHQDSPNLLLSVGEDGKIFSIDIREEKATQLLLVKDGPFTVQLHSIHCNPLNDNEFCIGGFSRFIRVYDRRELSTPLYSLCPKHLVDNNDVFVSSAVYNYNGTEVLGSYIDDDIYLFDTTTPYFGEFAHRFQGHRNYTTIKGVNFFGPKSEYILSGSDCGNIFIWDKNTEAIVQWMAGDDQGVVNHLEPHPHIPILATSGLDHDVKIWIPSCEHPPIMHNLEKRVKLNLWNRKLDCPNGSETLLENILWILSKNAVRRTEDSESESEDQSYEDNGDTLSNDNNFSD